MILNILAYNRLHHQHLMWTFLTTKDFRRQNRAGLQINDQTVTILPLFFHCVFPLIRFFFEDFLLALSFAFEIAASKIPT
jgi:hypothetical protein